MCSSVPFLFATVLCRKQIHKPACLVKYLLSWHFSMNGMMINMDAFLLCHVTLSEANTLSFTMLRWQWQCTACQRYTNGETTATDGLLGFWTCGEKVNQAVTTRSPFPGPRVISAFGKGRMRLLAVCNVSANRAPLLRTEDFNMLFI